MLLCCIVTADLREGDAIRKVNCGVWQIKCHQGSKTNKSNCQFCKKLTFDSFRRDPILMIMKLAQS
jgi:hypothetical protein